MFLQLGTSLSPVSIGYRLPATLEQLKRSFPCKKELITSLLPLSVVCVNHSDITHQHVRNLNIETMVFNFGACFPYCSLH